MTRSAPVMNVNSSCARELVNSSPATAPKPTGYYANSRDELLALVPENVKRVLEIGCGEGRLGQRLKLRVSNAVEVVGVEVCESAAAIARTRLDKVVVADVENLQLDGIGTFDCMIFADVLEHLRDPWETLRHLSRYLGPDGVIVASIPNIQHWRVILGLCRGSFRYAQEGILDSTHLRFFTRASVLELFSSTGHQVQLIRAHVPMSRSRLLNRVTSGLFEGFLAVQYHVVGRRRKSGVA